MAGEAFDAGSIFVNFKAATGQVQQAFIDVLKGIRKFGDGVQQAGQSAEKGGQVISQTFDRIDKANIQATAKLAKFTNRLLSLNLALSTVGNEAKDSFGDLNKVSAAATSSLSTFALTVSVLPTRLGVVVGSIAAVTTALAKLAGASQETKDAIDRSTDLAILKVEQGGDAFEKAAERQRQISRAFGATPFEISQEDVSLVRQRLAELEKLQADAVKRAQEADARLQKARSGNTFGLSGDEIKALEEELGAARALIDEFVRQRLDLKTKIQPLVEVEQIERTRDALSKFNREAALTSQSISVDIGRGLATPMQQVENDFQVATERVQLLRKEIDRLSLAGFQEQADKLKNSTLFSDALQAQERAFRTRRDFIRTDELANNFSFSVGAGIRDGILSGASAMETLAEVGRNLFESFVTDAVKQFQVGMTDAFKAIVGQGGAAFAGLFTTIAGIAGALFSRRKSGSSQTFSNLNDSIQSNQLVRGIVSGPTNVSIAAVGQNLERAFIPVTARLDVVIAVLTQIRNNTGGSTRAGGAPFAPFAGSVPTS